jgi:uncharacterized sporulation protein YeaH/YhbH (DUF444 family)
MADYSIIDRRKNPSGKNLPNRQRFLKRVRKYLREQVREAMNTRKIKSKDGTDISVPGDGINEPSFDYDRSTGEWERILPGNKEFGVGDSISKPPKGGGRGSGKEGSNSGGGTDDFRFSISRDEYLDLVFEDLELPDMIKKSAKAAVAFQRNRAGYQVSGSPSALDLVRSLKNSLGRRLALRRPSDDEIETLQMLIDTSEGEEKQKHMEAMEALLRKRMVVPWVDPIDMRYRRWENQPIPNAQAVMFCLMDVSGSMGEVEKEIAKRFYLLLYLFLQRKYDKVDIVFVRHTEVAKECEEDEFFNSQESGGTVISTGLDLVNDIINKRYPLDAWNIYVVQASDGDNYTSDNEHVINIMQTLLPKVQYYVYAEVRETPQQTHFTYGVHDTAVWTIMQRLAEHFPQLCHIRMDHVNTVVPTFREVFKREINQ